MNTNWGTFILGAVAGAAGAVLVQQSLTKTTYVSAEKALKEVKEAFKSEGTIDGSWIKMKPEPIKKVGMDKMVYKGGVSRTIGQEREQFEFIADSKTGAIMDVYRTY
ncbi:PepSY domain-containing protein [Pseudobacillus wudalianchiensis]|uniref:Peptidase M4 n=1 Tax=Pseudobacillus wudalianchiensis TaxID=1743143 RepID=A0A1B9B810_9BACI|nr:PepSY domain-containing protein [Bacillus wudalianchiensis]OCA92213.1 peptidase M4 [Bacillus wudalianchiensis]